MTYKTILLHVDKSSRSQVHFQVATMLAKRVDAHLVGNAFTGVSHYLFEGENASTGDPNLVVYLAQLQERARQAIAEFNHASENFDSNPAESCITNDDALSGLSMRARYCDLVIIGQSNRDEPSPAVMADFPGSVIIQAGRPVLVLPHSGALPSIGNQVLVAWDGSRESARAIHDALPLLKEAKRVHLLVVNPDHANKNGDQAHGAEPGADMALHLARHGITLELHTRTTVLGVGETILQVAQELSCDLIVMGGYGHTRFREMILGGATRTVLEKMMVPVLMSH